MNKAQAVIGAVIVGRYLLSFCTPWYLNFQGLDCTVKYILQWGVMWCSTCGLMCCYGFYACCLKNDSRLPHLLFMDYIVDQQRKGKRECKLKSIQIITSHKRNLGGLSSSLLSLFWSSFSLPYCLFLIALKIFFYPECLTTLFHLILCKESLGTFLALYFIKVYLS